MEPKEMRQETGENQKNTVMTVKEANEIFARIMSLDDITREWFINGLIDADNEKREGKKIVTD